MQQPQRPFIPHPTPKKPRPSAELAEFRLARPFVPGAERPVTASSEPRQGIGEERSNVAAGLPGIEEFLQLGGPATAVAAPVESYDDFEEQDELPPVEHFLDPLPPVSSFAEEFPSEFAPGESGSALPGAAESGARNDEGWLETAWQSYDWKAAAALGETGESEASNAWAETDWESLSQRANAARRPTAAQAIASALDEIARRIRDGDLVVPPSAAGAVADPTSIAATLASLLGIRE